MTRALTVWIVSMVVCRGSRCQMRLAEWMQRYMFNGYGKTRITGYLNVAFETSHPCTPLVDQAGMMRSLISHCHPARLLGFVWLLVVTDILRYLRTWISLLLADPRRFKTACGISILDPGWWFFFFALRMHVPWRSWPVSMMNSAPWQHSL